MRVKHFLFYQQQNQGQIFGKYNAFKLPGGFSCSPFQAGGSVNDSLFIVAPIVCGDFMFCPCVMQCLMSFLVLQSSR